MVRGSTALSMFSLPQFHAITQERVTNKRYKLKNLTSENVGETYHVCLVGFPKQTLRNLYGRDQTFYVVNFATDNFALCWCPRSRTYGSVIRHALITKVDERTGVIFMESYDHQVMTGQIDPVSAASPSSDPAQKKGKKKVLLTKPKAAPKRTSPNHPENLLRESFIVPVGKTVVIGFG